MATSPSTGDRLTAVVAQWPGMRTYHPGRSGWFGYSNNSRTVYHRMHEQYADGEPYVDVTTFDVPRTPRGRTGHLVTEPWLAHQLVDRLLTDHFDVLPWRFPISFELARRRVMGLVDEQRRRFLVLDSGSLWIAGVQLSDRAIVALARDVAFAEVSLSLIAAREMHGYEPPTNGNGNGDRTA